MNSLELKETKVVPVGTVSKITINLVWSLLFLGLSTVNAYSAYATTLNHPKIVGLAASINFVLVSVLAFPLIVSGIARILGLMDCRLSFLKNMTVCSALIFAFNAPMMLMLYNA